MSEEKSNYNTVANVDKSLRKAKRNFVLEIIAIILVEISCISQMEVFCEVCNIRPSIGYGVLVSLGLLLIVASLMRYKEERRLIQGGDGE